VSVSTGGRPGGQRVLGQVHQQLTDLLRVEPHPRGVAAVLHRHSRAAFLDLARQHLAQALERPHRRYLRELQGAGLGIGQEVRGQPLEAVDLGTRDRQQAPARGHAAGALLDDLLLEHLHIKV
jgi:hypothetical protein